MYLCWPGFRWLQENRGYRTELVRYDRRRPLCGMKSRNPTLRPQCPPEARNTMFTSEDYFRIARLHCENENDLTDGLAALLYLLCSSVLGGRRRHCRYRSVIS